MNDTESFQIEHWISRNRFTAGRRGYAILHMQQALTALGHADLAALCEVAYAAELTHLEKHTLFKLAQQAASAAVWTPEIVAADVDVDRLVSELRDLLLALAKRANERGAAANTILGAGFGQGVAWYTHAPFGVEEVRVAGLLGILGRHADEVAKTGAEDIVADLTASHTHYRTLIHSHEKVESISWDEVKASDLANQREFLELIGLVLARTHALAPAERLAARSQILRVAQEQDEAIREAIRQRRRVRDVHPQTGAPEA